MSKQVKTVGKHNATDPRKYIKATYYMKPSTIKALKIAAVKQDRPVSMVVREALERYVAQQAS